ncbi:MAG: AMP-binding protein, partial [Thermomicrobium sp.]|nr:AMP-binding protein [Thermomicrobium sp.]
AVDRAIEEGVTLVSMVGTMLWRMLEERGDRPYPSHLRAVLLGGGPAPRLLLDRALALRVPVLQTYGLTETASQLATLAPEDALRKLGSAGKPLYPNRLRIVREDGSVAPPGEPGEIEVQGPVVTPGYWRQPERTARAFRDGWLRTGDLGYLDEEGFLYVLDRRDDLVVTGGENVYPAEVEAVLLAHPAVVDAAVIGVPDVEWGQRVAAAVVVRPGTAVTEQELVAWCRGQLAGYKIPREIRFVGELPRTASGKLQRWRVRERWGTTGEMG